MHHAQNVVNVDPEIMSGTPVFAGTRVPLYNLFDYLEARRFAGEVFGVISLGESRAGDRGIAASAGPSAQAAMTSRCGH